MQFYYENKMPLRILDEGEFWKHQEAEHTEVIRALVSNLEQEYVQALENWEQAFVQTHGAFVRYIETVVRSGEWVSPYICQQITQLVHCAMKQSEAFIVLLNQLEEHSAAISGNPTAVVVINHIRRESEYFIGISQALLYQPA